MRWIDADGGSRLANRVVLAGYRDGVGFGAGHSRIDDWKWAGSSRALRKRGACR